MFPNVTPPPADPLRRYPGIAWGTGSVALVIAAVLAFGQGSAVRDLRQRTVPVALQLPSLEQRLRRLREQAEIADLHAALQTASVDEWVRTSVVPGTPDVGGLVDMFDVLGAALRRRNAVSAFGDIDVGTESAQDDMVVTPMTVAFTATPEGASDILAFLETAGLLTVGDVLTADERTLLMQLADSENPASVIAIEQFYATDLLLYATDSVATERRLQQAFAGDVMQRAIVNLSETSRLRDVRRALGGDLGVMLRDRGLWPLRFLTIRSWDEMTQNDGAVRVTVTVNAYSRK